EFFKPIVPGNVLQRFLAAVPWKIQTDHTDIASAPGSFHAGRRGAAVFGPVPDLLMSYERVSRVFALACGLLAGGSRTATAGPAGFLRCHSSALLLRYPRVSQLRTYHAIGRARTGGEHAPPGQARLL